MTAKKIHYLDMLGLAINGLLKTVKMESCTDKDTKIQKSRIVGITSQGEGLETECIEYHRIVRTWIIIKHYEKWGNYMITEEKKTGAADFDMDPDAGTQQNT